MSGDLTFLAGGGEAVRMIRERDWTDHPLGPPESWPPEFRTALSLVLNSPESMILAWGPELSFFFNDTYFPLLGPRLPWAMGERFDKVWADGWEQAKPIIDAAFAGRSERFVDLPWKLDTDRGVQDTWWTFSYSRVLDADGAVAGLFIFTNETTAKVLGDRHLRSAQDELITLNATLETQIGERTAELQLHKDIIQSSVAPICAFDTAFRLIAFNQAHSDEFYRIFGHRVRLGEVFPDLFPPDQAPIMRGFMARALAGEVYTVTEEFGDPELAKPYWEVSYSPLRNGAGEVIGAFHFAKDITARLKAENELAVAQEALRQSQKMEAVGQLTGGVAHDFNNLLTIIRSSVDYLRRPDLPEERRRRYMEAVSDAVDRAAKLTGQLLAFARRQALKPEVFEVGARLRAVADMLDTVTGARIRIVVEVPDDPCFIRVDRSQLETALINMAVNARDAMNGEGRLTLRLRCASAMPPIRGHAGGPGPFVLIELSDTGSGIAEGDLAHIFEPFFTTKAVGKGTGLGLSQVFGFAKQSGGDIDVRSLVGAGTTFALYLPEVEADVDQTLGGEGYDLAPEGRGLRVLVVEDNVEVGRFATQILDDLGYVTTWATNAEDALARLEEDGAGFDAVFSDVVMPGMGGIGLATELRRRRPGLPVVLASGYSHVLAENDTHGFELLHKPYSADQLSRLLRRVMTKPSASSF